MEQHDPDDAYEREEGASRALVASLLSSFRGTISRESLIYTAERIIRKKPLVVRSRPLRPGILGYTFSLTNCDLVVVDDGLDAALEPLAFLHEIGHVLRGHATELPLSLHDYDAQESLLLESGLHLCCYTVSTTRSPREHGAELFATLL